MAISSAPVLTQGIEERKHNQACPQAPASGLSLQADGRLSLNGSWFFRQDARETTELKPAPRSFRRLIQRLQRSGSKVDAPTESWQSIQVPANWFLEGQDIHGVAWYCRRFTLPQGVASNVASNSETSSSLLKLQFDGVDYASDVWLNGHYLGFHEGYFQPFGFDLAEAINPTGPNELLVRVNSPREAEGTDWSLRKRLIKGVLSHHDTRPGGAWSDRGQEQNTGGIWAPVSLQTADTVMVDHLKVTPKLNADGSGEAAVVLEVSNGSDRTQVVNLTAQLLPENFSEAAQPEGTTTRHRIPPGGAKIHLKLAHPNPKLWWTWDQGNPHLYRLDVRVNSFDGQADTGAESRLLHQTSDVFGFRTIERRSDDMAWYLNGRKIFIRGTNYIGSQWLSEMTPARFQQDMDLIRRANINAVRVHAHVTGREFYRQGDRQGILIWQDFPLQWGYEDTSEFLAEAKRQAEDMQDLLHNHPSIMAWSLHNEPPWDADWMKYKYESYDPKQNKQLDQDLYNHLLGRDPSRWLHLASLTSEHPWWGWYALEPEAYDKLTKEPLITEFGAQALPGLPTLRSMFTQEQLWPDSEADWAAWDFHNFQQKETFEIAKVEQGRTIEEFIVNSQTYQAELTQRAAEAYRRQRFEPVSAIFQFMFVENWPSINWGVVDHGRNLKPGYEALRLAYQPVLISAIAAEIDNQSVGQTSWTAGDEVVLDLWGINDLYQDFPGAQLRLTVQQKGESIHAFGQDLDLAANSGDVVGQFRDRLDAPGDYVLAMELRDRQGKLLSQNQFEFEIVP